MGPGGFFSTNPGFGDILGRTDFDFEIFWGDPKFPGPRFPHFQKSGLGPGLGPVWARAKNGKSEFDVKMLFELGPYVSKSVYFQSGESYMAQDRF